MYKILFFLFLSVLWGAQIQIGSEILTVEIADTHETRARGLMWRTELAENSGMLFVYPRADWQTFWMKNTLIPLSIGFFNEERSLIQIIDMDPPTPGKPLTTYQSKAPVRYALEVPQGWFERHEIKKGAKFSFLDQTDHVK